MKKIFLLLITLQGCLLASAQFYYQMKPYKYYYPDTIRFKGISVDDHVNIKNLPNINSDTLLSIANGVVGKKNVFPSKQLWDTSELNGYKFLFPNFNINNLYLLDSTEIFAQEQINITSKIISLVSLAEFLTIYSNNDIYINASNKIYFGTRGQWNSIELPYKEYSDTIATLSDIGTIPTNDSISIYATSPREGSIRYCSDCHGNGITGRIVAYIAAVWRKINFE